MFCHYQKGLTTNMRDGTIQVFSVGSRFAFLNDRGSTGKVKTGSEILGGPETDNFPKPKCPGPVVSGHTVKAETDSRRDSRV